MHSPLLLLFLVACAPGAPPTGEVTCLDTDSGFEVDDPDVDNDGDGFTENGGDCDDNDCTIHPGAVDGLDGLDRNCDDEVPSFYGCGYTGVDAAALPLFLLLGVARRRA